MIVFFYVLVTLTTAIQAYVLDINRIIDLLPERRLNIKRMPEYLPRVVPILPGHSLIRPSNTMFESAAKFPSDLTNAVYGNMENIGIRYENTTDRVLYTGFRKGNNILKNVLEAFKKWNRDNGNRKKKVIILIRKLEPTYKTEKTNKIENLLNYGTVAAEEENNANEILDESESHEDDGLILSRKSGKRDYRDRSSFYNDTDSNSSSTSSSGSSDFDRNPGNPFTIFKDKYRQNWLWNHYMDGDHVNINPYGPNLHDLGPSGAQLFFNRKWWYFNQDDYKPMG